MLAAAAAAPYFFCLLLSAQTEQAPHQPIEFNHKLHVTNLKVQCKMCHQNPDPGEMMGLPEVSTCIQCHGAIAPKTAAERKLQAFAKQNRDVDWVRVYQIPTYVTFSHRAHLQAGASCATCHGEVSQQSAVFRAKDISMGMCMDCHRAKQASIDCSYCHAPR